MDSLSDDGGGKPAAKPTTAPTTAPATAPKIGSTNHEVTLSLYDKIDKGVQSYKSQPWKAELIFPFYLCCEKDDLPTDHGVYKKQELFQYTDSKWKSLVKTNKMIARFNPSVYNPSGSEDTLIRDLKSASQEHGKTYLAL